MIPAGIDRGADHLPGILPSLWRRALNYNRRLTASCRVLPDYLIIGGQKCGTTSLFTYLQSHPHVSYTTVKEINFFTRNTEKGISYYRRHFPTALYVRYNRLVHGRKMLAGEATPWYLPYPYAPARARHLLPHARLIVMLRNPVDRAYSHYQDAVRMGFERLSFESALASEEERLAPERIRIRRDEYYDPRFYMRFAYRAVGIYADQLQAWMEAFPRDQMLILKSEDFFADSAASFHQVTRFLGIPDWQPPAFATFNKGEYAPMNAEIRAELAAYFAPHNQRLYELLGVDFRWD